MLVGNREQVNGQKMVRISLPGVVRGLYIMEYIMDGWIMQRQSGILAWFGQIQAVENTKLIYTALHYTTLHQLCYTTQHYTTLHYITNIVWCSVALCSVAYVGIIFDGRLLLSFMRFCLLFDGKRVSVTETNILLLRQGVSWCDDLDFKVLTKFCKPIGHSKYLQLFTM